MSHFSVLVRVPSSVAFSDLEDAVLQLLVPYKEFGWGDEEYPGYEKYIEFVDEEDDEHKKYESEFCDMVRLASGEEFMQFDRRFESKDPLAKDRYVWPEGSEKFEKSLKSAFRTFEMYMKEYVGQSRRDPKMKRYGHWRNPHSKWDWFRIGGRFSGKLPVGMPRPEHSIKCDPEKYDRVNACRISELDLFAADRSARGKAEEFWFEWQAFCDGKKFGAFDGPRDTALDLGLLSCKDADELTGKEWRTIPWDHCIKPGVVRFDVLEQITREEFLDKHLGSFSPLSSWARLDASGWSERGEMGWFAFSDATPESVAAHVASGPTWLASGDRGDWIVCVDCHI